MHVTLNNIPRNRKGRIPVRFVPSRKDRPNPWEVTWYEAGKPRRSYHPSESAALLAWKRYASVSYTRDLTHTEKHDALQAIALLPEGTTLTQAVKAFAEGSATPGASSPSLTLQTAVANFLERKERLGRSASHIRRLRTVLNRFAGILQDRQLGSITGPELRRYLHDRAEHGISPRTQMNERAILSEFFNDCLREQLITANPLPYATAAERPRIDTDRGTLTPAQWHTLLEYTREKWARYLPWLLLKGLLGVRDAEAARFRFEWFKMEDRHILLPRQIVKTGDSWLLEDIEPSFWQWLSFAPLEPSGAIPTPPPKHPRCAWKQMQRHLFAQHPEMQGKWARNALRHSYATYHLSLYRNPSRTALNLRHRSQERLWGNYLAMLTDKTTAAAWFASPSQP